MNASSTTLAPVPVTARFFDGRSADGHSARVWFMPGPELVVQTTQGELRHAAAAVQLDHAVGDAPRFLRLPGGQSCEFTDLAALENALASWPASTGLRRRSLGWRTITVSLIAMAFLAALVLVYGLPAAARQAAFMLPADTMARISRDSLAELDGDLFHPSRLSAERRASLLKKSRAFLSTVGEPTDRRIEFRSAPAMGPNAMALPSGVIVFTDDLVRLAHNDEQLLAVLAHECGHVHYRHSLRGILQNAAVSLAVTLVAGKQRSADSLQAALTTELVNSRHSRDFEFEADAYSAELLKRAGLNPGLMGEILDLLEQQDGLPDVTERGLDGYLRSHPATAERKQRLNHP